MKEEKIVDEYYKRNVITVLNSYSNKTTYLFYSIVYKKILERYGKEFEDKDLVMKLVKNGKIYTASIISSGGSFDDRNGNILINQYLNRLTTFVFHEIVHKISWIKSNKKGNRLNSVSNEGGTNIITNESLKTFDGKMLYFGKYLARHPNIINDTYLSYELFLSQLNQIIGNDALPKSILNGNNSFDKKCEKFYGEDRYRQMISTIIDIHTRNKKYWIDYKNKNPKLKESEKELGKLVEDTQNQILSYSFDKLSEKVENKKEAELYLSKLSDFSSYRIRLLNGKKTEDPFFVEYFNRKKKELEEKVGTSLETTHDDTTWDSKYKFVNLSVVEVPESEKREIREKGFREQKWIKLRRIQSLFGIGDTRVITIDGPLYKTRTDFERVQGELIKELQDKYKARIESSKKEKEDR